MNKKIKLAIIFLILVLLVPITASLAANKEGTWNGKDVKNNTTKWNGKTFASEDTTEAIFNAMNNAKRKTGEDRFEWLNSEPRNQKEAIWNLGADIYQEGVSCIGHRLAGWEGLCSIQVFDIYPNLSEDMSGIKAWEWQTLARLITESVGKGEDSTEERRVVQWCYDHSKYFEILNQDDRDQLGSWGADYESKVEEAKRMAINKFESNSTSDGKQEVVQKGDYTFIGPYNFTVMGGDISEISITTADNKEIKAGPNDDKIFVSLDGKNIVKMNQIKADNKLGYTNYSGNNFYIVYKGKISGANKIKITRSKSGYRARLVVVEALGIHGQNLILFDGAPSKEETSLYLPQAKPSKGNLKVIKVDEDNKEIKLQGVKFIIYNKDTKKYVIADDNYVTKGYTDKKSEAKVFVTNKNGEFEVKDLREGTYIAYETENPNHGYVIVENGFEKKVVADKTEELEAPNKLAKGNLKVIKVDKYNNVVKLSGVGFHIKNEDTEKYVKLQGNEVIYVDNVNDATEFITDKNGEFEVKGLIIGTYKAYETKNPNAGYEIIKDGFEKEVVVDKTEELKAENEQKYIKLSGYVWEDVQSDKQSVRNNLLFENKFDNADKLLKDIVVRLKYRGETIATTKTNAEGKYSFKDVEIEKLADYSIEFEYSGLIYENVVPHLDIDNGSKAIEGAARATFNNKFTEITRDTEIDGIPLIYNTENRKSTLTNGDKFIISSNTSEAKLNIKDKYKPGMKEIRNLNLGLYEREQPNLKVENDIDNVRITVNGYEHMYKYLSRLNPEKYTKGINVGVQFGEERGPKTYSRPVYKADYNYENKEDKSRELNAYITYKIAIGNNATGLTSKVNRLVNYFDSRYTLVGAGTEIGKDGNITGTKISYIEEFYKGNYGNYKKAVLDTNMIIKPQDIQFIYVQFSLSREAIGSILFDANGEERKEKILLDNVAEINSYTTTDENGALYAGVDKNSRPGNATPGYEDSYEADTNSAPALVLELANARKITGTVFEDSVTGEVKVGEERLGDGIYTDGEKTIPGVKVSLIKEDGSVERSVVTDENGYFELSDFMPGNYTLVYTWGDDTYTVDDYKGTIYKDLERLGRSLWYTENIDTRYSDAIDNYETRKLIDSGEHPEITTMDSSTPKMKLGIEMTDQNTGRVLDITPGIDKVEFLIKNVDFGIVERPRQKLDISKEVSAIKITAGNTEILNVGIIKDENGKLKADRKFNDKVFSIVQSQDGKQKALLWPRIDNELMDASTVQIEYTITVANNSELDYDSEKYYKYGIKEGNKVVVKPEVVYDYLDMEMALDPDKDTENTGWVTKTTAEYTNIINTEPTIIDEYISRYASTTTDPEGFTTTITGYESFIKQYSEEIREATLSTLSTIRQKIAADKTILYNANLEKELSAGEENSVKLYTSKKLASTDEIDLNNNSEIAKVKRNSVTGRKVTPRTSTLFDRAEEVIITPPEGENRDYLLTIILSVSTLVIIGSGIILIKKKILNK